MIRHTFRAACLVALLCGAIPAVAAAQTSSPGGPAQLSDPQRGERAPLAASVRNLRSQASPERTGNRFSSHANDSLLAAGEVNRSWDELTRRIVLGKKVTVTRTDLAVVEGKLEGITADSMTVLGPDSSQTVQREDVFRVRYAGTRQKRARWGMLIGSVAGAATLKIIDAASSTQGRKAVRTSVPCSGSA